MLSACIIFDKIVKNLIGLTVGEPIVEHRFNAEFICEVIRKSLKTDQKFQITATRIDEGKGFLSFIYRIDIKWSGNIDGLPSSVILKIPTFNKLEASVNETKSENEIVPTPSYSVPPEILAYLHNNECFSYEILRHFNLPTVPIPKIYHLSEIAPQEEHSGFIIMENMAGLGNHFDILKGMSLTAVKKVISSLAELHAYCMVNTDWNEHNYLIEQTESDWGWVAAEIPAALLAAEKNYPGKFKLNAEDLLKLADPKRICEAAKCADPAKRVFVHGDLWANNIMFTYTKDKTVSNELLAIIDWQTARPGNGVEDISRLLISSLDYRIRQKEWRNLLQFYLNELSNKLPKGFAHHFTLEELVQTWENLLGFEAIFMLSQAFYMDDQEFKNGNSLQIRTDFVMRAVTAVEEALQLL